MFVSQLYFESKSGFYVLSRIFKSKPNDQTSVIEELGMTACWNIHICTGVDDTDHRKGHGTWVSTSLDLHSQTNHQSALPAMAKGLATSFRTLAYDEKKKKNNNLDCFYSFKPITIGLGNTKLNMQQWSSWKIVLGETCFAHGMKMAKSPQEKRWQPRACFHCYRPG